MTDSPDNRIAIVGRAGRFSGVRNVGEYWRMLSEGRTAAVRLSTADLLAAGESRRALADPAYVPVAHPLPDMPCFDAGFWGFSPREAQILDPQHRHFLECAWEALEDAGRMPEDFDGRIGVFGGSGMQAYLPFNLLSNPDLVDEIGLFLLRHTGNDKDFLTTRLSYLLNLTGPSVAVQTACSTSLVAVHMAVNALLNMECEMALAGGVTIEVPHNRGYRFAEGEILSPDGLCRAFDDGSQGTVFGSGVGIVVLRRYEDAVADGDDIKAVILASAVNNDGAGKASYLAPSVDGQAEAAAEAVALAGVDPASITYIEAHGTGTPIGDPIELSALTQVYGEAAPGTIGIGSVKTNIGHLDTAAGTASLIKVIEAMRHKRLPANLNFRKPNQRFDWDASPFAVVAEGRDWISDGPRRAAVNSLGVGGTNAHVVVEEAPAVAATPEDGAWRLFPFSAASTAALEGVGAQWQDFLADPEAPAPADIAATLRHGRRIFPERMAVAARTREELSAALMARKSDAKRQGKATETPPRVVFLFPGGGAQYPGAGAEMMDDEPVFAKAVEACFAALPADAPADLREMMFGRDFDDAEAREKLNRSGYAIPALFILEYAYAQLWSSWGVTPDAIFAHSVGEYAGAVVAGAMTLPDALRIVTLRGQVMDAAPAGAMTTVPMCAEKAQSYLGDALDIAAINSDKTTVVSGQRAEIEALEARLADEGFEARRIHIDVAAHSRQLDGQLDRFRAGFEGIRFAAPAIPMVSSLRGGWAEGDDFASADYWVRHLRHTVRFTDAIAAALAEPDTVVIEVGPGQTLGPLVEAAELPNPPRAILPSAPRPRDEAEEMAVALASAGGLWAQGWPLDFDRLPGAGIGRRVSCPTYAFEKQRHWIEPGRGAQAAEEADTPLLLTRTPDMSDWIEALGWKDADPLPQPKLAGTDWLVFAGDDPMSEAVLRRLADGDARATVVRAGPSFAAGIGEFTLRPEAVEDHEALLEALPVLPSNILWLWSFDDAKAFGPAYQFAQALQLADGGAGAHLTFGVSLGAEGAVGPDDAALLGLVRVAPRELPGLSAALVDVAPDPALAPALLAEALGRGPDHVALRADGRALPERRSAPLRRPDDLPRRLSRGGVYVLTGGGGGVGREMARWLIDTAGARVALISRHVTPETGENLMRVPADVTDRAALERALDAVRAEWGTITGVIHGAGTIDDRPLSAKSLAEAEAVMAPKVEGARNLYALLPPGSIDLFAVISSTSVVLGGIGQADYAGANAALESIAAARPDGLSIAWGVWRDVGMAAREYGAGDAPDAAMPGDRTEEDGAILFATRLDPDTDWRLTGHVVGGVPVLPGTAYLELAYAAARSIWPDSPTRISDVSFEVPMMFGDGLPRRVVTRLDPAGAGYDVTILSRVGPEEPVEHVRLRIDRVERPDLPDHLNVCNGLWPLPEGARAAQEDLIAFGPRWNNVASVSMGTRAAEGEFALPEEFAGDLDTHPLHPALLDMAWSVGLHALPASDRAGRVYVPMSVGSVTLVRPLPDRVSARARLINAEPGRRAIFDLALVDASGDLVALIEDFALSAVDGGTLVPAVETQPVLTQLLATGIRRSEAPDLFARVFDHPERALIVSPVPVDLVRLAMEEVPKRAAAAAPAGSGGPIADPLAARLAELWSELLGVGQIGESDDFFALGGHSLNAVRLFGRIKKEFDVSLPTAILFEAPTLAGLAAVLRSRGVGVDEPASETEEPAPDEDERTLPMTEGQREIAAAILTDPAAIRAYNLSFSVDLDGSVDQDAMTAALRDVVSRHAVLRARVDLEKLELHILADPDFDFLNVDLSGMPAEDAARRRDEIHAEQAGRAFDLKDGPVFRAILFQLPQNRAELVIQYHHLICDGWSTGVVIQDIATAYRARRDGRAPRWTEIQRLDDLLEAEAAWAGSTGAAEHRDYWLDSFRSGVPAMDLPLDRPRPARRTSAAAQHLWRLDPALEKRLRRRAAQMGLSVGQLVFGAYNLLLSRIVGSEETVIGLPSAGQLTHGFDSVVAHSVNFLCPQFRSAASTSIETYFADVRARLGQAIDHQGYSYAELVRDLNLPRDPSRVAVVPVVINIDNLAGLAPDFGAPATVRINSAGHEAFEIFFNIFDAEGRVELAWNYLTGLFGPQSIALQVGNMERLLREICDLPGTAALGELLRGDTDRPASGTFDDPGAAGPQTITEIFARVAKEFADRPAVSFGGETIDYATLDARSDALAARLAALGVGAEDIVGITSERRTELVVAVLGVLKAGAGYVPFDLALPEDRLRFIAQDTGIRVLLGDLPALRDMDGLTIIPAEDFPTAPAEPPTPEITGESILYVMYTSGTTGRPKGVVLPHRSIVRMLVDTDWIEMGPDTVTLHSSSFAFDASMFDLFCALLYGGKVVIPPRGVLSIAELAKAIEGQGVNMLWLTAGLFHAVADLRPEAFRGVRQLLVGGDVVSPGHVQKVQAICPGLAVINGYGPTETHVCNGHTITPEDLASGMTLPIGRAIPGTQSFVIDAAGMPVPAGIPGELAVSGRALAHGYWNRPELTDEKFFQAAWDPGLRLYRTGDLVMDPGNGVLRFFGRIDTQVKIRGFRVELAEIEAVLEMHPAVKQATATAIVPEGQSEKVLAAYAVAEDGKRLDTAELRNFVRDRLPDFARPTFYTVLPSLPLNANGKVDRRQLPAPVVGDAAGRAAETPVEKRLARIWSDILGIAEPGADQSFFSLGGHSLMAVRLFDRIRAEFGQDLPISTLFANQTIGDLAALLETSAPAAETPDAPVSLEDAPWDTTTVIHDGPKRGSAGTIFIVGGVGGNVNNLYDLGRHLGLSHRMVGFQTRGVMGHRPHASIEDMAAENIHYMRQHQPHGPYLIAGYSGGALTAHEIVRQLEAAGETVSALLILDTFAPGFAQDFRPKVRIGPVQRVMHEVILLRQEGAMHFVERLKAKVRSRLVNGPFSFTVRFMSLSMQRYERMRAEWRIAALGYEGGPIRAPVILFKARPATPVEKVAFDSDPTLGWSALVAPGHFRSVPIGGHHLSMLDAEHAETLARLILEEIDALVGDGLDEFDDGFGRARAK
ncbi:amino acid adenylation domain-containing protein [Rhodobacterales bacterium HKCCE3408]|nr:amino acid adenylation domain-containing protein [Rhodobacterales bacterium HKCCE3408]